MVKRSKQGSEKIGDDIGVVAPTWMKFFVWSVMGSAVILVLFSLALTVGRSDDVSRFAAQGLGQYAEVIVENRIRAIWHAAFMTCSMVGFLWLFLLAKRRKPIVYNAVKWVLIILVAGDAWLLSKQFIKTMPLSALDVNPVISLLKNDMPEHRVALVSQDGFYNWWLTYAFPYHGIQTVNSVQMPRMSDDYKKYLGAVGRNPIRFWQMASVGYVLAPVEVWGQLQKDPRTKDTFDLVWCYNVAPAEAGVTVIPAMLSGTPPAKHVVLRFKQPRPRYALLAGWEKCDDLETLHRLASSGYTLSRKVLLPPEAVSNLPPLSGEGIVGKVQSLGYRSGCYTLKTTSDRAALLRVAEKFDHDWKATIDGTPSAVLRADYLFQALFIPEGAHEVVLKYAPSVWPLYAQSSGMLVCLLVALGVGMRTVFLNRRSKA